MRVITLVLILLCCGCKNSQAPKKITPSALPLLELGNLLAWCVVPFDSRARSPKDRAAMLKELGFTKFAYDWRAEHLESFPEEVEALKENDIELSSVWFWVDGPDEPIDTNNERFFELIEKENVQTEIWVCLGDKVFAGLDEKSKLDRAVEIVQLYYSRAKSLGCTIALYNHGAWFGEPTNQIKVIESLGYQDIKIVYNFHHAHKQLLAFPELVSQMQPYLSCVNINGMKKNDEKILPVGTGDLEAGMLQVLIDSGYDGHIGIIGHVETADVKDVLSKNLKGLSEVSQRLLETRSN